MKITKQNEKKKEEKMWNTILYIQISSIGNFQN